MRFEFKPSFDRSVKNFHGREKEEIKRTAIQAIDILSQDREIGDVSTFFEPDASKIETKVVDRRLLVMYTHV